MLRSLPRSLAAVCGAVALPYFPRLRSPGLEEAAAAALDALRGLVLIKTGKRWRPGSPQRWRSLLLSDKVASEDEVLGAGLEAQIGLYERPELEQLYQHCLELATGGPRTVLEVFLQGLADVLLEPQRRGLAPRQGMLDLYFWLTRYIPAEHLEAMAERVLRRAQPVPAAHPETPTGMVDAHVHLTGAHLSLHGRLQLATGTYAARLARGQRGYTPASVVAVVAATARLLLHAASRRDIYMVATRASRCTSIHLRYSRAGPQVARRLYGCVARSLGYPHRGWLLDPIAAATRRSSLEAEKSLIMTASTAWRKGFWPEMLRLYLRLSMLLHRYIAVQPPYWGLEAFSEYYERTEALLGRRGLLRRHFHGLMDEIMKYYGVYNVYIRAKLSPGSRGTTLRLLLGYIAKNPRAADKLGVYISLIKKPCMPLKRRQALADACTKAAGKARTGLAALQSLLRSRTYGEALRKILLGVDVAGPERLTPNWLYKPYIEAMRALTGGGIAVSFHAGEDYYNVLNGLRRIYEAVELVDMRSGDSIGHALALAAEPLHGMTTVEPKAELLADIVFAVDYATRRGLGEPELLLRLGQLAERLYLEIGRAVEAQPAPVSLLIEAYNALYNPHALYQASLGTELAEQLRPALRLIPVSSRAQDPPEPVATALRAYLADAKVAEEASKPVHVAATLQNHGIRLDKLAELLREIQESLARDMKSRGVYVESCPVSNTVIRHTGEPSSHPIARLRELGLTVCIGSDDPAALAGSIYLDYLVTWEALARQGRNPLQEAPVIAKCSHAPPPLARQR